MRFFVVNRTGVPVHIRLDETDSAKTYLLTFSGSRVSGGRPLMHHVLATTMPLHITHLDDNSRFVVNNRIGVTYSKGVDAAKDYLLVLIGFIH